MDNVTFVEVENVNGELVEHVIIDHGNDQFTSMPKIVWDELEGAKENGTIS
jgi:hypothetical protein